MDAATLDRSPADAAMDVPRARIGLIIPSVNSMSEPQFNHFAPPGLAVHVARARVAGPWKRPLPVMAEEIATSAQLLSDVSPDLIVFHCTDTSMTQGPQGEGRILDIVHGRNRHPGGGDQPAGAGGAADPGSQEARPADALSQQQGGDRLSDGDRPCRRPRHCARPQGAGIRQRHAGRMGRACPPARPAGRRRHLPELHQHHPDRGDRRDRAHARQAGRQQQPGGAVGLHASGSRRNSRRSRRCRSSAA